MGQLGKQIGVAGWYPSSQLGLSVGVAGWAHTVQAILQDLFHTPAYIVRTMMIDMDLGAVPSTSAVWPIYVSQEPSDPDNVITVYDTVGVKQGRIMFNGEVLERYGIQVRVRSANHVDGYVKADTVKIALDKDVYRRKVQVDDTVYRLHAFTRPGAPLSLGKQPETRRDLFTINPTVLIKDVTPTGEAEDTKLDLGNIGIVYNDSSTATAVANTANFEAYISSLADESLEIDATGPQNPLRDNKREPGHCYFDLSGGPVQIIVGGAGKLQNFLMRGFCIIHGINAASATTPVFEVTRTPGTKPEITFKDLRFESDGSGIEFKTPGATTRAENIHVNYTGSGTLDFEGWSDLDTAPFGMKVTDADGLFVTRFACSSGNGHGVIVKRWNAGRFEGNIREQAGVGMKGQQIAMSRFNLRSESNTGYALLVRNCGSDRYTGSPLTPGGSTNKWIAWFEANNGRNTIYNSSGYSFSQFKMENCARVELQGHTGWRNNQARLDAMSRQRNLHIEEQYTPVSGTPVHELVTNNTVDINIDLPPAGFGNLSITNWDVVWTNASFRPTVALFGTPGTDERIRVTWPADSFNNTATTSNVGYWRPWGGFSPQNSPGAFYFEAEVEDVDGNIASYCASREAASNRQTSIVSGFVIEPVSGGLMTFPLWDTNRRKFSGQTLVDDTRSDISPAFNAWIPNMQDQQGNAPQNTVHTMDIWQLRMWKLT